jgi:hypothetical protein
MELIQSKSLLAKLMATENLTVEQRNVPTASFDTENRILTVPTLDDNLSSYLYDLFFGHEVGHALYTPMEGLRKAAELKIPKSISNVLEDVRIEKKIKTKYPGIRASFIKGYRELVEKDFFGTANADLNQLNFIDRVNLYTKGGPTQGIKFKEGLEKELLNKIESTETYDDILTLSVEIMKYLKEEQEERKKNQPKFEKDDGTDEFDFDEFEDELLVNSDGDSDENDFTELEDDDGELKNPDNNESTGGGVDAGDDTQEIRSFTDETFHQNENKLFAVDKKHIYYGNIPDVDLSQAILGYKEVWKNHRQEILVHFSNTEFSGTDLKAFQKIRNDSKKVVGYLAKEFELRKNADQLKRASIAKTGDLNMSKIYAYKLTDDIFKKMTVVPGAKSHGLVMFLDWSGSMHKHLENTAKQLINLVMFCKKVNIPYEVYAFSSESTEEYWPERVEGEIKMQSFKLLNLFSSKMSASEFTYAGSALMCMAAERHSYRPRGFNLGGTPLTEAIISAMKIVPEFQKSYKLQIVNTVFLTDGDGHSLKDVYQKMSNGELYPTDIPYDESVRGKTKRFTIRDPITKHQEYIDNPYGRSLTSKYIQMLKVRTGCNIVGFYVLSGREFGREARNFFPSYMVDGLRAEFRKNKALTVTSAGYDEYYLLRSEGLDTDDDVEFEVKENATTRGLVTAFSKYTSNRLSNRVVLNRFVGMIS